MKLQKGKWLYVRLILTAVCALVVGISIYQLSAINRNYRKEKATYQELLAYKPGEDTLPEETPAKSLGVIHPEILELQQLNPDTVGWLYVPDTKIDYPIVKAKDYEQYLRTDFYGENSVAGTLFLDYRFAPDLSGSQSIIFGHSMKNGSMFGELKRYRERSFYEEHQEAYIFLPDQTIELSLVACVETKADDSIIYGAWESEGQKEVFWEEIKNQSLHGSEAVPEDLDTEGRFLFLSTCTYTSGTSRLVVIFEIREEKG